MILLLKETKFVLLNMTTKNTRSEFCTSPVACQGREERCQARWEGVGFLNPLAEFFKSGGDPIYVRGSSLPLLCNISLIFGWCWFHLVGRLTRWEGHRPLPSYGSSKLHYSFQNSLLAAVAAAALCLIVYYCHENHLFHPHLGAPPKWDSCTTEMGQDRPSRHYK